LAEETEIPKVPHQEHIDNFFRLSRRNAQRIRTGGKKENAEFYKGVMDRPLNRIQRVRPARSALGVFFLLHDNAPVHKAAFANF
jgi:hypothetical protein